MPATNTSRRCRLTIEQKLVICTYAKKARAKESLTDVAEWATRTLKLKTPLSRQGAALIVKREAHWVATAESHRGRKQVVSLRHRKTDDIIMKEINDMEGTVEAVTGDVIRQRNGISQKRKHGEAASVDDDAVEEGRKKIRKLTDAYPRSEIYNFDETAFFFRQDAKTTLTQKKAVSGRKDPKNRITLALAVNADGPDKLPPLYIGSAAVLRPLQGRDVRAELGVIYKHSPKAWMTTSIFLEWLGEVNHQMWLKDRKILLLVDNVSSHVQPEVSFSNIRLAFLPKNTTSRLQPLDQGIIRSVKSKYSKKKVMDSVERYYDDRDQIKVDLYTALKWSKEAFDGVTSKTITNCWKHAGILSDRSRISSLLN
ncbi:hypothetical protein PHYSODRAFT_480573 [Phytophthora sojae]|uniref:DDE-1 domain-containing protein n=1 Tax=Phytophthora sojae (strain P6497) TaxID=1094619 RepID=G4YZ82_PHYSP|nr:hypothetical protein PHYSODRAFT_480573 [Phytophthora sojae]EGZ23940.1 hypothetical protein PHYSODRAFT_480573 [Phytophthora sojae]|eukprot:XP_009519228.1 hypothetical protein PHYSODRAFT_480573 [Phytophthora sojae]